MRNLTFILALTAYGVGSTLVAAPHAKPHKAPQAKAAARESITPLTPPTKPRMTMYEPTEPVLPIHPNPFDLTKTKAAFDVHMKLIGPGPDEGPILFEARTIQLRKYFDDIMAEYARFGAATTRQEVQELLAQDQVVDIRPNIPPEVDFFRQYQLDRKVFLDQYRKEFREYELACQHYADVEVPAYRASVEAHKAKMDQYDRDMEAYNAKVEARNALMVKQGMIDAMHRAKGTCNTFNAAMDGLDKFNGDPVFLRAALNAYANTAQWLDVLNLSQRILRYNEIHPDAPMLDANKVARRMNACLPAAKAACIQAGRRALVCMHTRNQMRAALNYRTTSNRMRAAINHLINYNKKVLEPAMTHFAASMSHVSQACYGSNHSAGVVIRDCGIVGGFYPSAVLR